MKTLANGLLAAETFSEHMQPDVVWLEDPAFAAAFDAIAVSDVEADIAATDEHTRRNRYPKGLPMAAHTNLVDPITGTPAEFPAFINIRFEGGRAIVSVRGDPTLVEADDDNTQYFKAAKTVEATFEQGDWDQFVAEATRERGLVPGG